jgi:hypothetical protein
VVLDSALTIGIAAMIATRESAPLKAANPETLSVQLSDKPA